MSIHEPPSSYMLRKMSEVTVPDHVSWFPQTIGWKIVAAILAVFIVYQAVQWSKKWWENRYRREAIALVGLLQNSMDKQNTPPLLNYDLFEVMKAVLTYLNPNKANVFGEIFLIDLDYYSTSDVLFHDELGLKWIRSLVQQKHALSSQELAELIVLCQQWLADHAEPQVEPKGEKHAV
ncbi:DUF4381 domain-containing protein [Aliivibrio salmonicida]|uniref:DUF4381 domain-containing protein n=1 Tax=Aliivibrio salmonicida TaxID=40269 RepID=UPI00406BE5BD